MERLGGLRHSLRQYQERNHPQSQPSRRKKKLGSMKFSNSRWKIWKPTILTLDNDEAGNEARPQIASRLSQLCFVRGVRWPAMLCEPDELSSEHLGLFQG
jgi:hypothetical protein